MSEIKPIAYDLFCGLGGWTEGLLAAGYDVTGFDIEAHEYGDQRYPGKLVIRDVLAIHGSELADAALLVCSPPCQAYSYMAMPWSRAKAIAAEYRSGVRSIDDLNALFNACFRIQREASEAAGRYIPMVVENVKGAQPWVGPAKAHFGSFYLWGDVEMVGDRVIAGGMQWGGVRAEKGGGRKVPGMNFHDYAKTGQPGRSFQGAAVDGLKVPSTEGRGTDKGKGARFTSMDCGIEGNKGFAKRFEDTPMARLSSKSLSRKAASAQIAKIPYTLSHYIANAYKPK